jgi:hypothetical protein
MVNGKASKKDSTITIIPIKIFTHSGIIIILLFFLKYCSKNNNIIPV